MNDSVQSAAFRRDRAVVLMAIGVIAIMAWAYVFWFAAQMGMAGASSAPAVPGAAMPGMNMPGMNMPGMSTPDAAATASPQAWSSADFIIMFTMWVVMMIGMMTPSVTPMLLLYAAVGRNAAARGRPLAATGWFLSGYLSAWVLFSLVATGKQWALVSFALVNPMMEGARGILGGVILLAAGLYQWSPLKNICLSQCQSPLGFLMRHGGFRPEAHRAMLLGAQHGLYCVGCCWALMILLFVGGVMNLLWIAGLAILVLLEKVLPAGRLVSRIAGTSMVMAGLILLLGPIFI